MNKPEIAEGEWNHESIYVKDSEGEAVCEIYARDWQKTAKAISAVPEMIDALISVRHSIDKCKTDRGSVILGDKLETEIEQALIKAGCTE